MRTLSAVFALVVASLAQTTIEPAPAAGIAVTEADGVEREGCLALLGAANPELTVRLPIPPDDLFPGRIVLDSFFNEEWSRLGR